MESSRSARQDAVGSSLGILAPRARSEARVVSASGGLARLGTKPMQEASILTAVRRHMDALEERIGGQITQAQKRHEKLHDAVYTRVDSKMGVMEALQPKFDRRLAELSGNCRAISDELQAQIRRADQVDARVLECQHRFEEEIRAKILGIEQEHQQMSVAIRVTNTTNDDLFKRYNQRLLRLESLVDERLAMNDDTSQTLMNLHSRLAGLEQGHDQDTALCKRDGPPMASQLSSEAGDNVSLAMIEARAVDGRQKIDNLVQDSHELHMRLETQEERLKSLRTLIQTKDDHYRSLSDRIERIDWDARFKEIQGQVQELGQHRSDTCEKMEILERRVEGYQQECRDLIHSSQGHAGDTPVDNSPACEQGGGVPAPAVGEALATLEAKDCLARLGSLEAQLGSVAGDLQAVQADVVLGPRISALVEQLRHLAPQVIDHERSLAGLHEKIGRLDVEVKMDKVADAGKNTESIAARVGWLEVELARLKSEVYNTEMPKVHGNEIVEVMELKSEIDAATPPRLSGQQRRATATE